MCRFGGFPLLVVLWCGLAHSLDNLSLDEAWESWKITHRREYNGLVSKQPTKPDNSISIDWVCDFFFIGDRKPVCLFSGKEMGKDLFLCNFICDYSDWNVLAWCVSSNAVPVTYIHYTSVKR